MMSSHPKKYIKNSAGTMVLNPAYTAWKNMKQDAGAMMMPDPAGGTHAQSYTVPVPMAVAIALPDPYPPKATTFAATATATTTNKNKTTTTAANHPTLLAQGRSKRVLVPQPSSSSKLLGRNERATLKGQGYTEGLIRSIGRSNSQFPLRIWVVDNSGSMVTGDGHRLVQTGNKTGVRLVDCSRWSEIRETVEYHAQIAALLGAPTVFRLLNDPGRMVGPQQFGIGERGAEFVPEDLAVALSTIQAAEPQGVTPLTEHVREIRENVLDMTDALSRAGQKVVIVLATDGLPSDARGATDQRTLDEFRDSLKSLEGLPVWIVVRLCTDKDDVVSYYNDLDSQLELSLEVIDDFTCEAEEVHEHNKWLNYALPLQRMREMGFSHKLFDLLDERKFTKEELRQFSVLLFGTDQLDGMPDPEVDWNGFLRRLESVQKPEQKQWNPVKKRVMPWIDVQKLNKIYGNRRLGLWR